MDRDRFYSIVHSEGNARRSGSFLDRCATTQMPMNSTACALLSSFGASARRPAQATASIAMGGILSTSSCSSIVQRLSLRPTSPHGQQFKEVCLASFFRRKDEELAPAFAAATRCGQRILPTHPHALSSKNGRPLFLTRDPWNSSFPAYNPRSR